VVKQLVGDGVREICLCLKPGRYELGVLELAKESIDTLSIEGCCPDVTIDIGSFSVFGLAAVVLRGLDIALRGDPPLVMDGCADVTIDDCRIWRVASPGAVCTVGGAQRVRFANSTLDGHVGVDAKHVDALR